MSGQLKGLFLHLIQYNGDCFVLLSECVRLDQRGCVSLCGGRGSKVRVCVCVCVRVCVCVCVCSVTRCCVCSCLCACASVLNCRWHHHFGGPPGLPPSSGGAPVRGGG